MSFGIMGCHLTSCPPAAEIWPNVQYNNNSIQPHPNPESILVRRLPMMLLMCRGVWPNLEGHSMVLQRGQSLGNNQRFPGAEHSGQTRQSFSVRSERVTLPSPVSPQEGIYTVNAHHLLSLCLCVSQHNSHGYIMITKLADTVLIRTVGITVQTMIMTVGVTVYIMILTVGVTVYIRGLDLSLNDSSIKYFLYLYLHVFVYHAASNLA